MPTREVTADHFHEACDRAYVIMETFGEHVLDHRAVKGTPALRKKAQRAFDALFAVYQDAGLRMAGVSPQRRKTVARR